MNLSSALPNWQSRSLVIVYVAALVWWLAMLITGSRDALANNSYGLILGLIPVLGGLQGLYLAKQWGGFGSAVGKALWLLSLGLVFWGLGTWIFSGYYNLYSDVEVPYPSIADVG